MLKCLRNWKSNFKYNRIDFTFLSNDGRLSIAEDELSH